MCYGNGKQAQRGAGAVPTWVGATGPSGTFWGKLRRQVEAARAGAVPVLAVRRLWLMFRVRSLATQPVQPKDGLTGLGAEHGSATHKETCKQLN